MSPDELHAFLDRSPGLVGAVATLRPDGFPHVVPVWYRWDGKVVNIWSLEERVWVQNILRDPRVAFSVQETVAPFAAAVMRGRAGVASSDRLDIDREIQQITRRYLPEPEVAGYITGWSHARTIVQIHPTTVRSWRRGY